MSEAANNHKVATLLKCIEEGFSPEETAEVFRKHAEILNACCDGLIKDAMEKKALINVNPTSALQLAGTMVAVPTLASYLTGRLGGHVAASALTSVNENPVSSYQKADEILRLKGETENILSRVNDKKKKDEERSKDRSVRALF